MVRVGLMVKQTKNFGEDGNLESGLKKKLTNLVCPPPECIQIHSATMHLAKQGSATDIQITLNEKGTVA